MDSHELVELAALVSWHGPAFVQECRAVSPTGLEQYWSASKCRMNRWATVLKQFADSETQHGTQKTGTRPAPPIGAMQEILLSDVLTRTWTAALMALEQRHGGQEATPIARSILLGQTESRNRVLAMMADSTRLNAEDAVKLNQLRRRAERWNDLLISRLVRCGDVSSVANEPQRARELAGDLTPAHARSWSVMLSSLQLAFRLGQNRPSPNRDLNAQIAGSILACFHSEMFESTGLPSSLWATRLLNVAEDTQALVEDLWRLEA